MKKFKKEQITCYLLDSEVKGYKISFKKGNGMGYQIIEARRDGRYDREKFLVLNSEVVISMNGNEDQNEIENMTDAQVQEWTVTDDRAVLAYSLITGEVKYDVMYVKLYYTVSDCYAPLVNWFTI